MHKVDHIRHLGGLPQYEIARKVGCSQGYVSTVLNNPKRGVRLQLQEQLKHDCFSIQTFDADFWAGVIAADGCITGNRVQIGLQESDKEFLELWQSWCNSKHKIARGFSKKSGTWSYQSAFKSEQMIEDLKKYYNIGPRKSLNAKPPNRKSLHFIAGLFMGDGHISFRSQRQHYTCGFCGSKDMMEWVRTYFTDLTKGKVTPAASIYEFAIGGRYNAHEALVRIFDNSPFVLDRKYQRYLHSLSLRKEVRCGRNYPAIRVLRLHRL